MDASLSGLTMISDPQSLPVFTTRESQSHLWLSKVPWLKKNNLLESWASEALI